MITRRKKISQEIINACKKNSESEESDSNNEQEEQEDQDLQEIIIEAETDSENEEQESTKVKADKVTSNVSFCKMISTLEPVHTPIQRSEGGFHYVYEAETPDKIDGNIENLTIFFKLSELLLLLFFIKIGDQTVGIGDSKAHPLFWLKV